MQSPLRTLLSATALSALLLACNSSSSPPTANSLPAVGSLVTNPVIGGLITRLSDSASGTAISGDRHLNKTDYSRIQAENADGSKLLVYAANADNLLQYALLPTAGGTPQLIDLPNGNASGLPTLHDETEARWHPTHPNLIRFIKGQNSYLGDLKVFEYNIVNHDVTVLADLTGKLPSSWGPNLYGTTGMEGTFSKDGNRLAWAVETAVNNAETPVGYVAFDLRNGGEVLGTLDYDDRQHDHLSISPSGEYVVISARTKTTSHPVDFSSERVLLRETQHSDLCITPSGADCYVAVSFDDQENSNYGWVFVTELATGEVTPLLNIFGTGNTSLHLSGRALNRPGWALMSTYNCSSNIDTAKCNRLSLIELTANPRVIDLTGTHSSGNTYYTEPHGTISRDGLRAYFNSDWDNSGATNVYKLDIPASTYNDQ